MRFLKSIAALLLLATPAALATPIGFTNAIFNDPYSDPADTLLKLSVDTNCPSTVQVTVTVPAGGIPNGFGGFAKFTSGTDFGPIAFNGLADSNAGGTLESATVSAHFTRDSQTNELDGGAVWTFTSFNDYRALSTPPNNFVNGGYIIFVDILNTLFNNGAGDNPAGLSLNIKTSGQIQISSETSPVLRGYFDVDQTQHCGGDNPPGSHGDPVFAGFQGQNFQFHGLPDEHFNLVSSPDVQLNSHFVYLSSGKCDYNDTECFTHPGTYMDVLGLSVADSHVKMVAGTHEAGLRIWVNDIELSRGQHIHQLSNNVTSSLRYHHNGRVEINTDVMALEVVNSDMFFNIRAALNDAQLLQVGSTKHTVTDHKICKTNSETHNHQLIESTVAKKYPVTTQLHGLIGQTWRNVKVCGKDYMGVVQDYVASDLFANDYHYSYFKW
jgi:hypothetical protein